MAETTGFRGWLSGRAGRREYWVLVGVVFAVALAFSFLPGLSGANSGLTAVLIFVQIRRLHDFDRTGWWSLAALLAPVAAMIAAMIAAMPLDDALWVGIAAEVVGIVLIGAFAGSAGSNRFGEPADFSWRRLVSWR